jgi:hypothetical protein
MKEVIITDTRDPRPYHWVSIYHSNDERKEIIGHFDCFYEATRFIKENNFAIAYLDDDRENKGQFWGVRVFQ